MGFFWPSFFHPPKQTAGSPENGVFLGISEIPDLETIISRFQPLIFGGVLGVLFWLGLRLKGL